MFSFIVIDILSETGDVSSAIGGMRSLHGEEARGLSTHGYGSTWMDLGGGSDVCFFSGSFLLLSNEECVSWLVSGGMIWDDI